MSQPYIGEIRVVGFNFAPVGWALCNGALLSISEYSPLFNLLGTTYGGDGQTTFALPNLMGRIPFHQGSSTGGPLVMGQAGGTETVTLQTSQLPAHTHALAANSTPGTQPSPAGGYWAQSALDCYSTETPTHAMNASSVGMAGGNQPHDNMPPFTVVNFIISLFGIYPSQS